MTATGGRLETQLADEAQAGIFLPWIEFSFATLFPLLGRVNKAHLLMLHAEGHLGREETSKLLAAIVKMEAEGPEAVPLDGALEDVYFNYEAALIRLVGPDLGGRMHLARSRNDVQATLDRLRTRSAAVAIRRSALRLRRALLTRAARFLDCVMPGYTHLQHAQPITFGWYLLGIEQSLQRDDRRLAAAFEHLNFSPLGSGAIAGTTFKIDRQLTAKYLGFAAPAPHALDAVTAKDPILETLNAGLFLATTIGRLAQDFYQFSTHEFSMLDLPDSLAITSSMMPQKKNQAVLEFIKGRQAKILGAVVTGFTAMHAKPYSHVLDASAEGVAGVWEALESLDALLPVVTLVVEEAEPRTERMRDLASENFCTATDLADLLVRNAGLPFKQAHRLTGHVVRTALERGDMPGDVGSQLVNDAARDVLGRTIRLSESELKTALDPAASTARRKNCGGPSQEDSNLILRQAHRQLERDENDLKTIESEMNDADISLELSVKEFL